MTNRIASVANTIIYESSVSFKTYIDNMKLQKLFYFCYGKCLVDLDVEISDESFEAWPYGCVIPSLYQEYKRYKFSHVRHFAYDSTGIQPMIDEEDSLSMKVYKIIESVLASYVRLNSFKLSEINHKVGGAWWETKKRNGIEVKKEDILNEFRRGKTD